MYTNITYLSNYTKVLDYTTALHKDYADNDMHEGEDYTVEIYYRVVFDDYKVKIVVYYEIR